MSFLKRPHFLSVEWRVIKSGHDSAAVNKAKHSELWICSFQDLDRRHPKNKRGLKINLRCNEPRSKLSLHIVDPGVFRHFFSITTNTQNIRIVLARTQFHQFTKVVAKSTCKLMASKVLAKFLTFEKSTCKSFNRLEKYLQKSKLFSKVLTNFNSCNYYFCKYF